LRALWSLKLQELEKVEADLEIKRQRLTKEAGAGSAPPQAGASLASPGPARPRFFRGLSRGLVGVPARPASVPAKL
jgi:hypothetical protein